jgi:hypothetical protein
MRTVPTRQRWNRQPPLPAPADRSNPLSRGLSVLWSATAGDMNLANGQLGARTGTELVNRPGAAGVARFFPGGANDNIIRWKGYNTSTGPDITFLLVVTPLAGANTTKLIKLGGDDFDGLHLNTGSDGATWRLTKSGVADISLGVALTNGEPQVVVVSYHHADGRCRCVARYLRTNVIAKGTATNTSALAAHDGQISLSAGFIEQGHGDFYAAAAWGRTLSDAEMDALVVNPWQLFARNEPTFWSVAAGGTTYEVSVSETATAADTCSVVVVHAAALAESGAAADTTSAAAVFASAIAESGAAADSTSAVATLAATVTETVAAADPLSASLIVPATIAESLTAAETADWGGATYAAAVDESVTAVDTQSATSALVAGSAETLSAADVLAAQLVGTATLTESSPAIDAATGLVVMGGAVTESVTVADSTNGTVGEAVVTPTWPAGGTRRVGASTLKDSPERIGGATLRGIPRRIG